jgi:glucose/arabinose dehydrogenase
VLDTVVTGLKSPWGLAFLPDGSALVSQRNDGTILQVADGAARAVGIVPGVVHEGEGGLLGLAVAPTFASDHWLYAYLSTADDNRIVRMRYDDAGSRLGAPEPLLTGIPMDVAHNGGRLTFGPDGMLYASTGDAVGRGNPQDVESLGGKILRLAPDGSIPADNPFPGSPVWSLGHRNVQGLAFDANGQLWATEFGQDTWDELNRIEPGKNYGWPIVEGRAKDPRFVDPVQQWEPKDASPSGLAIADNTAYVASLRGERLWQVPLSGGKPTALFAFELGRLRTVAVAPDGSLWVMTNNTDGRGVPFPDDDRIVRLPHPPT